MPRAEPRAGSLRPPGRRPPQPTAATTVTRAKSGASRSVFNRRVLFAVTAAYLVALGIVLLWPDHIDRNAGAAYAVLYAVFPGATATAMDFGLNVVLFLPFGALLATILRGHPWVLAGVAWVVPLFVELFQGVFLPGRTSSVLDVAANTLGGLIGAALTAALRRAIAHRHARTPARRRTRTRG